MTARLPLALAVSALLAACTTTRLEVEIDPPGVPMESVTIGGTPAIAKDGVFRAKVRVEGENGRSVPVVGTSRGGVVAADAFHVESGKSNRGTLRMPAEVRIRLMSPASGVVVKAGDDMLSPRSGVYVHRTYPGTESEEIVVSARDEQGNIDERAVEMRTGERAEVDLNLALTAAFRTSSDAVRYGEPIEFDASGSTPGRSLRRYHWDLGDGQPRVTSEPRIRHTYPYDPDKGERGSYQVTLRVEAENGRQSAPATRVIAVSIGRQRLGFDVETFPKTRAVHHPGEVVQLVLTPRPDYYPKTVDNLKIDFGDGHTAMTDASGDPLTVRCSDGRCAPIVVRHTYTRPGRFAPTLTYSHPEPRLGPFTADLWQAGRTGPVVTVTPRYLSDAELKDRAWQDLYDKLDALLRELRPDGEGANGAGDGLKGRRLALTCLDHANFETDAPQFVPVVERLTRMLVADGYHVLEKSSPVLARLAPEAVVDIRAELGEGVDPRPTTEQVYRPNLDYGLATTHEAPDRPIVYSIKLEGTDDRLTQLDRLDAAEAELGGSGEGGRVAADAAARKKAIAALRNLPILVARFETAENLIALRVEDEPAIEQTPGAEYSELFGQPLTERKARLRVRVRVLERSGRILDARDITGEHAELVLERGDG